MVNPFKPTSINVRKPKTCGVEGERGVNKRWRGQKHLARTFRARHVFGGVILRGPCPGIRDLSDKKRKRYQVCVTGLAALRFLPTRSHRVDSESCRV